MSVRLAKYLKLKLYVPVQNNDIETNMLTVFLKTVSLNSRKKNVGNPAMKYPRHLDN